jgi:GxxExxY protein
LSFDDLSGLARMVDHRDTKNTKNTKIHTPISADLDAIGRSAVDAGLKVQVALGPGVLESVYEHCLAFELRRRGIEVRRQVALPLVYEGISLDAGYRIDLLLAGTVIIEVKSVDSLIPLHQAQLLTYLRLSKSRLGYLMNFNVPLFKDGIKRMAQ